MPHLSKLAEKCKNCSKVNECDHKEMVMCGYLEVPSIQKQASLPLSEQLAQPLLREQIKSPLSPFKYKDELEKELHKELQKQLDVFKCSASKYGA